MNAFDFASNSPFLAFFITWMVITACVEYPMKLVNRWIRHRNIVARGWPPVHLDADGDAVESDDETTTEE